MAKENVIKRWLKEADPEINCEWCLTNDIKEGEEVFLVSEKGRRGLKFYTDGTLVRVGGVLGVHVENDSQICEKVSVEVLQFGKSIAPDLREFYKECGVERHLLSRVEMPLEQNISDLGRDN